MVIDERMQRLPGLTRQPVPHPEMESGTRLGATDSRARIKATIVQNLKYDRGAGDPKNVAIVSCGFDRTLAGKNLAEITRSRGQEPTMENAAEVVMDLVAKGGCSAQRG